MPKTAELSYHQQAWLQYEQEDISGYNITGAVLITGRLDRVKLNNSLQKVIDSQDITRAYFIKNNNQFESYIKDVLNYTIKNLNASKLTDKEITTLILKLHHHKFNLVSPPLFKIETFSLSEDKHLLVFCFHHLINDAIGLTNFTKKIKDYYYEAHDIRSPEGNYFYQFSDFVKDQKFGLNKKLKDRKEFWRKIRDFEPLIIREAADKNSINNISHMTKKKIYSDTKPSMRAIRTNLLTAQFILDHIITGEKNIYIATPITERKTTPQRDCIGFASGPMMLTMSLRQGISIGELKNQLDIEFNNNFKNYLPLPLIDRKEHHKISINLFDSSFLADFSPWENISYQFIQPNSMGLDMFIHCFNEADFLDLQIHYDTGLYSNEFIQNYISNFSKILNILNSNSLNDNNLIQLQPKLEINTHEVT